MCQRQATLAAAVFFPFIFRIRCRRRIFFRVAIRRRSASQQIRHYSLK